jgi:hypothetical protein
MQATALPLHSAHCDPLQSVQKSLGAAPTMHQSSTDAPVPHLLRDGLGHVRRVMVVIFGGH